MVKILKYGVEDDNEIFTRFTPQYGVEDVVSEIMANVKANGDKALYEYSLKFDKAELTTLAVTQEEMDDALNEVSPELLRILTAAAANIRKYHEKQVQNGYIINDEDGIVIGRKVIPIDKVGLYVPGGTAPYPSTVLMDVIPAKIAGCRELVMVTPPGRSGRVNSAILAAAHIAGVDKIFKVGGAQAIAALTYGTESIPKVDKIVGPGNAYVTEAKKQAFSQALVSIDAIAGPSEVLIVSDANTPPEFIAADMLAQAEHDVLSTAVLLTDSPELALQVQAEVEKQLDALPRKDIASAALERNGKIVITQDIATAVMIANEIAPEHLELCVDAPFDLLDKVKNAGSIFLGRYAPEPLGDYYGGTNHTLPTGGTARFGNPLSVEDFVKKSQYTYYTKEAFRKVYSDIAYFARQEELNGHERSCLIRFEEVEK